MKELLKEALNQGLKSLEEKYGCELPSELIEIKENPDKEFGDFSTNLAFVLSKRLSEKPNKLAQLIIEDLDKNNFIEKVEVAGPGFINFFLFQESRTLILKEINEQKEKFGLSKDRKNLKEKVLIEYVSSNPTGPLHVGHGRGAAFGSTLANILRATGHDVDEEYYVNDQGRQMEILSLSVWLRYLEIFDLINVFPNNCYKGEYIFLLAKELKENNDKKFCESKDQDLSFVQNLSSELSEEELDNLVKQSKEFLSEGFDVIKSFSLTKILENIQKDLINFGVKHTHWFKESSMFFGSKEEDPEIDIALKSLDKNKHLYKKDGATWFKSKEFGDEKDRVVKRENGATTYFASDIAYHANKFNRNYSKIINIWGSDHHGYLPRVRGSMEALGEDIKKFEVVFIQFANLVRGGKKISMSTRSGEFITLMELINEVSSEAARFFYINRKSNQHLEFDLDLAKEESKDNPLYYIQYAHARICSVFGKLSDINQSYNKEAALKSLNKLDTDQEIEIQQLLGQFPEVIERSADNYEPHLVCYYLRNLAGSFHSYYNKEKILVEDNELLQARLFLIKAIRQVIFNGLKTLGISAPETM